MIFVACMAAGTMLAPGCASRRAVARLPEPTAPAPAPPVVPADTAVVEVKSRPSARHLERTEPQIPLPGTGRLYPSEEPGNQPAAGAAEAFPVQSAPAKGKSNPRRTPMPDRAKGSDAPPETLVTKIVPYTPERWSTEPDPAGGVWETQPTPPAPVAPSPSRETATRVEAARVDSTRANATPPSTTPTTTTTPKVAPAPRRVDPPPSAPERGPDPDLAVESAGPFFSVQLFASASASTAEERRAKLVTLFEDPVRIDFEGSLYKVRVSLTPDRAHGEAVLGAAKDLGYDDAFLVVVGATEPERR